LLGLNLFAYLSVAFGSMHCLPPYLRILL
jgi:hypothetical protein